MDSIRGNSIGRRFGATALVILVGGGLLAGCAGRGSVAGRVHPPSPDTVVQAVPVKDRPSHASSDTARVIQRDGRFEPRVLTVQAGEIIEFVNDDRIYHNAFCLEPKGRFDLGRYRPGQMRRTSFAHPGEYEVFCELHPNEILYVVVADERWNTNTARDGSFLLGQLPRGEYVIRAWNPRLGSTSVRVTIPRKESLQLRLGS
jgi:plastocyanin